MVFQCACEFHPAFAGGWLVAGLGLLARRRAAAGACKGGGSIVLPEVLLNVHFDRRRMGPITRLDPSGGLVLRRGVSPPPASWDPSLAGARVGFLHLVGRGFVSRLRVRLHWRALDEQRPLHRRPYPHDPE